MKWINFLRYGRRLGVSLVMILMLQACVVVPHPVPRPAPIPAPIPVPRVRPVPPPPHYAVCDMATQKWALKTQKLINFNACLHHDPKLSSLCLGTFAAVVPLGSLLVSGSIYLVGNTLNWLEYQARCDDGLVQKSLAFFDTEPKESRGTNIAVNDESTLIF